MSNIRWDDEAWEKVTPRHWRITHKNPARFFYDTISISVADSRDWQLFVNGNYIATFPSWEEASQAAPMLYQLHKEPT